MPFRNKELLQKCVEWNVFSDINFGCQCIEKLHSHGFVFVKHPLSFFSSINE